MGSPVRKLIAFIGILAMFISTAPAALASPADVQSAPAVADQWDLPGPGVVANETGAPGTDIYIVLHRAPSLAQYRGEVAGLAATSPTVTGASRLDIDSAASQAYLAYLASEHDDLVSSIEASLGRSVDVVYRYDAVLNGVAVRMTANEASSVSSLNGVRKVSRDEPRELLTDNGPRWIGADEVWGEDPIASGCEAGSCGEGVVVGVIDTGINHDHPSFAEVGPVDGYVHSNPKPTFLGLCDPLTGAPFCNDKLIGYHDFTAEPGGPDDLNGHGSHTASTAAGNVVDAEIATPTTTFARRISGVAPHANIIAYKACGAEPAGVLGCFPTLAPLLAAINQATLDEVDVINYSIGGSSSNPWVDDDAQAFFDAYSAGIFVATSAGNSGPGFGTLGSPADAPWVTSVGASTHDRLLQNGVVDIDPFLEDIIGKSLTASTGPTPFKIVYAGDYQSVANAGANAALCGSGTGNPATGEGSGGDPFPPGTFDADMIVLCDRGEYGRVFKGEYVKRGGAGGYILANDVANGNSLVGDPHVLPAVHISYDDGVALKAHLAANSVGATGAGDTRDCTTCVVGRINGTSPDEDPGNADIMAGFSSRGANPAVPDVIKPDVTAPGVDIFAAFHTPTGSLPGDPPEYGIISGTSMSSPHTAGAGALVIGANPTWTPDQVKSALMSTAFTSPPGDQGESHAVVKEDGVTPADPFDMGGGRVDLHKAADAGLIMEVGAAAYEAANPALSGDAATLNIPSLGQDACLGTCSWTRTVEATTATTWTASTSAPAGMILTVEPSSFSLAAGETQEITVTANVASLTPKNVWTFAEVQFTPADTTVPGTHFPVAVIPKTGGPPTGELLYLHGNLHDDCDGAAFTADGRADLANGCDPFMSGTDLDPDNPAAKWGPLSPLVNGTSPQNIHDPNWIWVLDEPTTLDGAMVVTWWAGGPASNSIFTEDFNIRLYADGALHVEERVTHNILTPNVPQKLMSVVNVGPITATTSYVLQIDPVYIDSQQGSFIYYDAEQACPGADVNTSCDSSVLMPVDDGGDPQPPVANDDNAFVLTGGTVTVDVTANDFDPEGGPITVSLEPTNAAPANGTVAVTFGNGIEYTHDGGPSTSDSFEYTITDNQGLEAVATVFVTISDQCFVDGGTYFEDFESGDGGWTVDTFINTTPGSMTWTLGSDVFDPLNTGWYTDALGGDNLNDTTKDVRLVSPEFLASPTSHLTFLHRYDTEATFDGGVLEVSLDGGLNWSDVEAVGGVFVTGGYDGPLGALNGRDGWSGQNGAHPFMSAVDVDLSALSGKSLQVRYRLVQDILVQSPGGGWWVDDVSFTDQWVEGDCAPVANDDSDTVTAGSSVDTDVKANDFGAGFSDPSALEVEVITAPGHGTAVVVSPPGTDGLVRYTHDGGLDTSDFYEYRLTDPATGASDTAIVTITIDQGENPPPDAVDDSDSVDAGGSVTVDVKANDSDPNHDNAELTVSLETTPASGTAGVNPDGTITYTHNGDGATADSFQYRLTDPLGAFDIATVFITINQPEPEDRDKLTGGGYLLPTSGKKINFGFNAKSQGDGSLQGHLTLNDKSDGVKIRIDTITSLSSVDEPCATIPDRETAAQFTGTGTFNNAAAEFRVCVADNGEPGNDPQGIDQFYLECTSGCAYNTADRTDDDVIDGGNIQVHMAPAAEGTEGGGTEGDGTESSSATVLILDPMLVTEAPLGDSLQLTVAAFGADSEPMTGIAVTLTISTDAGLVSIDGLTDASGLASFVADVVAGDTEFQAHSDLVSSNTIDVTASII